MSKIRTMPSAYKTAAPKNEKGEPLCRWCKVRVFPPRKTFCSAVCVHEWQMRTSSSYLRACVRKRDKGICAKCGIDTYEISKGFRRPLKGETEAQWKTRVSKIRKKWGISKKRVTFWDLDHILEVANGGGTCDLSNCQSLCIPCHRKKTNKFITKLRSKKNNKKT